LTSCTNSNSAVRRYLVWISVLTEVSLQNSVMNIKIPISVCVCVCVVRQILGSNERAWLMRALGSNTHNCLI
jgi:hypothetical protein